MASANYFQSPPDQPPGVRGLASVTHFLHGSAVNGVNHSLVQSERESDHFRRRRLSTGRSRKARCPSSRAHPFDNQRLSKNPRTCFEGPFGEVIRATGPMAKANPFRFSTKYQDEETDLLYYGYRYYSTSTGGWLSRDPLDENGGENLNAFVGNDPLGQIDYLGLADPSEPSLSGKAGKAKPGECGAFTWPFTWQLTGGKTKKGGSIVQHMTWTFSISDSNGALSNDALAKQLGWDPVESANYWELFKVDGKGKIDPKTDTWKGGPWPNTKGTITITGSASFYPGVFVPPGFGLYPNSPALGLLWTSTDPGLSNGLGTVSRRLTATWDCTCTSTSKKTNLSTDSK
jgi:RHS repeat-associated protein